MQIQLINILLAFIVGGVLCWDSSESRNLDDDAVVDNYHCMRCGTSYEVYQPNEEEKEDYKEYWQQDCK
jgi:DNA-directed RNA polymerase subunit RPC12/RpoP